MLLIDFTIETSNLYNVADKFNFLPTVDNHLPIGITMHDIPNKSYAALQKLIYLSDHCYWLKKIITDDKDFAFRHYTTDAGKIQKIGVIMKSATRLSKNVTIYHFDDLQIINDDTVELAENCKYTFIIESIKK